MPTRRLHFSSIVASGFLAITVISPSDVLAAPKANLVLAIGGEPETGFDPLLGWGSYGHPLFQSTLLRRDADLRTQPDLATEWTLSDDRLTWTVRIRKDAHFSDGTPLTAKDVAFTFDKGRTSPGTADLEVLESVSALDEWTVVFTLKRPWITFTEYFHTLGIVPASSYGPNYGRQPLGSGPYRFVSWSEGEQLIVERNPEYYGAAPQFDQMTFLFTGEAAAVAGARTGVVDVAMAPPPLANDVPKDFNALAVHTVDNRALSLPFAPVEGKTTPDGHSIGNDVTSDPAIRRAINMGLDRDTIVEVALHGHGTPAWGPSDGLPWAGADDKVAFDLPAAKALLDRAGWLPGPDGTREKGGLRAAFPINYPANDATRQLLAETATEMLRPLGIEATPKGGSWSAIGKVMHSEPVIFGFGSHSPYQLYALYNSTLAGIEYLNPTYYANSAVDDLFAQAQAARSLDESFPLWSAAAGYYGLKGDASWAWLVNLDHVYFLHHCLDVGRTQIEPHGHGWPITASIVEWRWTCP